MLSWKLVPAKYGPPLSLSIYISLILSLSFSLSHPFSFTFSLYTFLSLFASNCHMQAVPLNQWAGELTEYLCLLTMAQAPATINQNDVTYHQAILVHRWWPVLCIGNLHVMEALHHWKFCTKMEFCRKKYIVQFVSMFIDFHVTWTWKK